MSEVILTGNNLVGVLPPELGGLESLEVLYLAANQLTGEIPSELGGLESLEELALHDNQLTGEILPNWANSNRWRGSPSAPTS